MRRMPNDNEFTNSPFRGPGGVDIVSKTNPLHHYLWGNNCDGWTLVDKNDLSVKLESMPAGTEEALHYHEYAQQFFFILKGVADFEIEGSRITVNKNQGIHINPQEKHRIINGSDEELEFILCSQPSTQHDRHNIA
ncbi:MAG TPA: cupin domain-containing protein [Puia sp.]|nr:cupin domain-containing protein [Puia sp.]